MSIKYKVAQRTEPGKKNGGNPLYYARATNRKLIDYYDIADDISKRCTARQADVLAVLTSLSELIPEYIMDGKSIRLNRIGIISATLQAEGLAAPDGVTGSTIKGVKLHFLPDKEIKKQLRLCNFSKE